MSKAARVKKTRNEGVSLSRSRRMHPDRKKLIIFSPILYRRVFLVYCPPSCCAKAGRIVGCDAIFDVSALRGVNSVVVKE